MLAILLDHVERAIERLAEPLQLWIAKSRRRRPRGVIAATDGISNKFEVSKRLKRGLEDPVVQDDADDDADGGEAENERGAAHGGVALNHADCQVGSDQRAADDHKGVGEQYLEGD